MKFVSRLALAISLAAINAPAAYYFGKLNITGSGVTTTTTLIDFQPGANNVQVGLGNSGSFAAYVLNSLGTVLDIPPVPQDNWLVIPGQLSASANWRLGGMVFAFAPPSLLCTPAINLNESCIGQSPTPIVLTRTLTGTSATVSAFGTITDGGDVSSWTGILSAQFVGLTPAEVACASGADWDGAGLGCIPGTGSPVVTWSANFDVQAPEPGTVALFVTGLALTAVSRRKRK